MCIRYSKNCWQKNITDCLTVQIMALLFLIIEVTLLTHNVKWLVQSWKKYLNERKEKKFTSEKFQNYEIFFYTNLKTIFLVKRTKCSNNVLADLEYMHLNCLKKITSWHDRVAIILERPFRVKKTLKFLRHHDNYFVH